MFLYRQGNFSLKIIVAILIFVDSWPEESSHRVSENNCFIVKKCQDFLFQWVANLPREYMYTVVSFVSSRPSVKQTSPFPMGSVILKVLYLPTQILEKMQKRYLLDTG